MKTPEGAVHTCAPRRQLADHCLACGMCWPGLSAATGMRVRMKRVRPTRRGLVLRGVTVGAEGSVSMNAVVVRAPVRVLWDALNAVLSDGRAVQLPEVRLSDGSTPVQHTQHHRALVGERPQPLPNN